MGTADHSDLQAHLASHDIHTVEVAVPDTHSHLRGKRVPVGRFWSAVADDGVNIADAVFAMDLVNDLPDNEFINMDSGYLDTHLVPDLSTTRILTHRPGYALVFCDAKNEHGDPHPLAPRTVLTEQLDRCRAKGLDVVAATEMEAFLLDMDGNPAQDFIQYSSLTVDLRAEAALYDMRQALIGAGMDVESSNAEYGPGQIEINVGPADALTTADNTALYKSIVKQVAAAHGYRVTFMPKPWEEHSGSGMHIHTSLNQDGKNAFASSDGAPNELMGAWLAGQLEHATAMTLLAAPTPNGMKRIRPYTFAPTHVNWGLDNRTVLARCITEAGSSANRVEFRLAGADANPYLMLAAILAAGLDGIERSLVPGTMGVGDQYTNPGAATPFTTDYTESVTAFSQSPLGGLLGDMFTRSYTSIAVAEDALYAEHGGKGDEVNQWERDRYLDQA